MTNLIIDIGNSMVKYHVFRFNRELHTQQTSGLSLEIIQELTTQFGISKVIWSSVRKEDNLLYEQISQIIPQTTAFSHTTPVPLKNHYKTPETLGLDRLAAAIGAADLYPDQDLLILDFGTALTIDFVDANGNYWGGNISPGMHTRFQSLHDATGRLPVVKADSNLSMMGKSTVEAINNGVINGMVFEVRGYIQYYSMNSKNLKVVATGGDSKLFDNLLKNSIFVVENLVALGLNSILNSNA